jgi:hypothetical protein
MAKPSEFEKLKEVSSKWSKSDMVSVLRRTGHEQPDRSLPQQPVRHAALVAAPRLGLSDSRRIARNPSAHSR